MFQNALVMLFNALATFHNASMKRLENAFILAQCNSTRDLDYKISLINCCVYVVVAHTNATLYIVIYIIFTLKVFTFFVPVALQTIMCCLAS